jgi:pilus assembly protein CpaE
MAHEARLKSPIPGQGSGGGTGANVSSLSSYGKVILIYSPKGGTGSTTVAVNLAMALHNEETPCILVDGNLQFGDVAVFLNVQAKNSLADLAPRVDELDHEVLEEVLITHNRSGVKVLAAPARPEYAESVTGDQFNKILDYLRKLYSYIVVDTSSTLTDVALSGIDSADVVVLLTTQDIPSIKNSRLFMDLADILKIKKKRILFVMNRFDKRIGITPEKISESFKHEISGVIPTDDRVVIPSINRGIPFIMSDKSKPVSRAVLALAESIRARMTELAEAESGSEQEQTGSVAHRIGR